MNKSFLATISFGLLLCGVGCSGNDGAITLAADTAPLTAQGNDKLFSITVTEAREGGYPLEGVSVKAIKDDKDFLLSCTPQDVNTNKVLDKGDTLTCVEAATDQFNADVAGTDIDVELYAKIDGEETKVGSATWTPAKTN